MLTLLFLYLCLTVVLNHRFSGIFFVVVSGMAIDNWSLYFCLFMVIQPQYVAIIACSHVLMLIK